MTPRSRAPRGALPVRLDPGFRGEQWIVERLEATRSILRDHFALQSGQHAECFLRFRAFCTDRQAVERLGALFVDNLALAEGCRPMVLCPESAGYDLGRSIATHLGGRPLVAQVDRDRRPTARLLEGRIEPGRPVIVVNDVLTTGRSVRVLMEMAHDRSGVAPQLAVFARQAGVTASTAPDLSGIRVVAAVETTWPMW